MLQDMKARRNSLQNQIDATHSEELREVLIEEQDALRRTVLKVTDRLEEAYMFLDKCEIEVRGKRLSFLDAFNRTKEIFQQAHQMRQFATNVDINDCGIQVLRNAKEDLLDLLKDCADVYEAEFLAYRIAFEATMVDEQDVTSFNVAYDETSTDIQAVWDGGKWKLEDNIVAGDHLEDYLSKMNEAMVDRTCPPGTVIKIQIFSNLKGGVTIKSDIHVKTQSRGGWYGTTSSTSTGGW